MLGLFAAAALASSAAHAWMDKWAPAFECSHAEFKKLSSWSVSNYVCSVSEDNAFIAKYCSGGALDLNGDGTVDYVFTIPWMGCGLNANGYDVHFLVSDGAKGRMKTVMGGYGAGLDDLVKVSGKTYFRHSEFFNEFEKSKHNHWVFQMFSFDRTGAMKRANKDVGPPFPAVTIFYDNPKFRQIELTGADLRKIEKATTPVSKKAQSD